MIYLLCIIANYAIFASNTSIISFNSDIEHTHFRIFTIVKIGGSTVVYPVITNQSGAKNILDVPSRVEKCEVGF